MKIIKALLTLFVFLQINACVNPQVKFRKARLLDPMMDPAKTSGFHQSLIAEPSLRVERGTTDIGGTVGGSCPTCGG